jgi:hypothetical protein
MHLKHKALKLFNRHLYFSRLYTYVIKDSAVKEPLNISGIYLLFERGDKWLNLAI